MNWNHDVTELDCGNLLKEVQWHVDTAYYMFDIGWDGGLSEFLSKSYQE